MHHRIFQTRLSLFIFSAILLCLTAFAALAQKQQDVPLTSQELVKLVYQLPKQPDKKSEVVEEIRRRGIGFPLTDGMRSLVASKSGNDALLKRTLEEAERRRVNPTASALPSEREWQELLEKTRAATRAATEAMPDFVVKQLVTRSYSRGGTNNWLFSDRLAVAVSYRAAVGEEYKVLTINGMPPNKQAQESPTYADQVEGGATSAGEYASTIMETFDVERQTVFKPVDTDILRGRRTIVFEYRVEKELSGQSVKVGAARTIAAYHGRMWIDRELNRVLRMEIVLELPEDFPAKAASNLIDYEWVNIAGEQYLLPSKAEMILAYNENREFLRRRNLIIFRGYQKYGSEVKIIEEDIVEDPPQEKP